MVAFYLLFALLDIYWIGEFDTGATPAVLVWLAFFGSCYGMASGCAAVHELGRSVDFRQRLRALNLIEAIFFFVSQTGIPWLLSMGHAISPDHPIVVATGLFSGALALLNRKKRAEVLRRLR